MRSHRHARCLSGDRGPHRTETSGLRVPTGTAGKARDCARAHARVRKASRYAGVLQRLGALRASLRRTIARGRSRRTQQGDGGDGRGARGPTQQLSAWRARGSCEMDRYRSPWLLRGGRRCRCQRGDAADGRGRTVRRGSDLTTDAGDRSPIHARWRVGDAGRSGHETMIATSLGRMQGIPVRVSRSETMRGPVSPTDEPKYLSLHVSWAASGHPPSIENSHLTIAPVAQPCCDLGPLNHRGDGRERIRPPTAPGYGPVEDGGRPGGTGRFHTAEGGRAGTVENTRPRHHTHHTGRPSGIFTRRNSSSSSPASVVSCRLVRSVRQISPICDGSSRPSTGR